MYNLSLQVGGRGFPESREDSHPDILEPRSDRYHDEIAQESARAVRYVRPPGSIFDNQALLVISEDEVDRIDPGNWFKIDSVYPLFPPGTKPFQQKRPRRQQHRVPPGYTPYENPYAKPEPDYTKPPYVAPKPYKPHQTKQYQPGFEHFNKPHSYAPEKKPFTFPTSKPDIVRPTRSYLPPVTPQYQNPPPSYDDHLPYQLHPETIYDEHDLSPQPHTPKPFVHHEHAPYKPHKPKSYGYVTTPKPYHPQPTHYPTTPKPYEHTPEPPYGYSPKPYDHSPKPKYSLTPKPYTPHYPSPTPKGYYPTPNDYAPTPKPYTPTPKPYAPTPKHYAPTPKPYPPTHQPYSPTPTPYRPEVHHPAHRYPDEEPNHHPSPKPKVVVQHFGHLPSTPRPAEDYHHEYTPGYHASPRPEYHEPEADYHTPRPEYHEPEPEYHTPRPEYHEPEPEYHTPKPVHLYPEYSPYKPVVEPYEPVHIKVQPNYEVPLHHGGYEPEPYEPEYHHPVPKPHKPTPSPYTPKPKPAYSPTPKHYTPAPKPYSPTPEPYSPTPAPYTPVPKHYSTTQKPYSPTPEPYLITPKPHHHTPAPEQYTPQPELYSPTPKPYTPTPEQYSPTPQPYTPTTPEPYSPTPKAYQTTLKPYKPTPKPYEPTPVTKYPLPPTPTYEPTPKPPKPTKRPFKPTPKPYQRRPELYEPDLYQPYKPEPEPYQPYKPEPEPSYGYNDNNKYKHFPVVEAIPAHPLQLPKKPAIEQDPRYRLPKKQEFSNFPNFNPYNEFAEQDLEPVRIPDKRKVSGVLTKSNGANNFVTPRTVSKNNKNKGRQPVDPLDK